MGPYKPLRTWVEFPIPYYMEMSWELIDPIAHIGIYDLLGASGWWIGLGLVKLRQRFHGGNCSPIESSK